MDDMTLGGGTRRIAMSATPGDAPSVDWPSLLTDMITKNEAAGNISEPDIKQPIIDALKAFNEPGLKWDDTTADPDFGIAVIKDTPVLQIKGLTLEADFTLLTAARKKQLGVFLNMIGDFKGKIGIKNLNLANPKGKTGMDGAKLGIFEPQDGDLVLTGTSGEVFAVPAIGINAFGMAINPEKMITSGIQNSLDAYLPIINGMRALAVPTALPPLPGRTIEKVGLKIHAVTGGNQVNSADFLCMSKVKV